MNKVVLIAASTWVFEADPQAGEATCVPYQAPGRGRHLIPATLRIPYLALPGRAAKPDGGCGLRFSLGLMVPQWVMAGDDGVKHIPRVGLRRWSPSPDLFSASRTPLPSLVRDCRRGHGSLAHTQRQDLQVTRRASAADLDVEELLNHAEGGLRFQVVVGDEVPVAGGSGRRRRR